MTSMSIFALCLLKLVYVSYCRYKLHVSLPANLELICNAGPGRQNMIKETNIAFVFDRFFNKFSFDVCREFFRFVCLKNVQQAACINSSRFITKV